MLLRCIGHVWKSCGILEAKAESYCEIGLLELVHEVVAGANLKSAKAFIFVLGSIRRQGVGEIFQRCFA